MKTNSNAETTPRKEKWLIMEEKTNSKKLLCPIGRFRHDQPTKSTNLPTLQVLIDLQNKGYSESTIRGTASRLKHLSKHCNLENTQETINYILERQITGQYKNKLFTAYQKFLKYYKIEKELPQIRTQQNAKIIRIPSTQELDTLINSARIPLKTKLLIAKDCGLRPVETVRLQRKNIDFERKLLYPKTAKNGAPRVLKIPERLAHELEAHVNKHKLQPNDQVFNCTVKGFQSSYYNMRNRTAIRTGNPQLQTIRLYDFRHYFGTTLYAKTKDILYVQKQMGHKRIATTMIYVQLLQFDENEEYTVKCPTTKEEEAQLIEHGFIYVREREGIPFYKKRK